MQITRWLCVSLLCCLPAGEALAQKAGRGAGSGAAGVARERGRLIAKSLRAGGYWQYLPTQPATGVFVVAHGRPEGAEVDDIPAYAESYARRWMEFAEQARLALLVPVFDEAHFGSVSARSDNFGGLFGNPVASDAYVADIVSRTGPALPPGWDGRIALYGHLAGARFATHYATMHPDRVRAMVVTAPNHYAMPVADVAWPNGMRPIKATVYWGPDRDPQRVSIQPDPAGWARAATIPTVVIVGARDTAGVQAVPGHVGTNRVAWANQWVETMNPLAGGNGKIHLVVLPGVVNALDAMVPAALTAMQRLLN